MRGSMAPAASSAVLTVSRARTDRAAARHAAEIFSERGTCGIVASSRLSIRRPEVPAKVPSRPALGAATTRPGAGLREASRGR